MSNILKYQNPSSPLLNPHKIIENIPAREWGPRKINEDGIITEGEGTSFLHAPFQYWGDKGLGLQNEKLARDLVSDFTWMMIKNPNYNPILDKNYQSYDDAVNYLNHLEGLKKYLGLPYDTGLLMESKYKPTRLQGTNEKTYKFKSSTVPGYWDDVVDDMVIREYDKNQYYDQSLNEFTAYRDRDEKGDFVSIYDEWDYNPAVRGGNKKLNKVVDSVTGGKPFVIYDRIYLDDHYDVPEEARGNPFITPAVVTANAKHENGGVLKAQEGTGNLYTPHLLSPIGIALNQARSMAKGKTHLPPGVKEVVGPDGKKVAIRTEQPLVPLEQSIAEWLPGTGDVAEVGYIVDDVKNGNYGTAALAAGLIAIPGNAGKLLSKHRKAASKTADAVEDAARKANIAEYINNIDDTYIDPVHLERVAKSEQITRFNKFAKKYGYPEITDLSMSNSRLDELTKNMLERHNTYYRGVVMTPEVEELAKTLNISNEEALKIAATTPRKGESHVFVSPTSNAGIYGGGTSAKIRRPYKLGSDRTKWFNEANFQIEPPYAYGGNPQAEVIYPWHRSYPETNVPNELLLKKGEFVEWMNNAKIDDYVGSNNRIFSNYDSLTGLEFLPLEKFKQGRKL